MKYLAPVSRYCIRVELPMGFKKFTTRLRASDLQFCGCMVPNVANALAGNKTKKLSFQFSAEERGGSLPLCLGEGYRAIINQDGKRNFGLAQIAKKGTSFLQVSLKIIYVD